jgi:sugar phosphate isomerase/epimerase
LFVSLQFGVSTHLYHDVPLGPDQLDEIAAHGFGSVEVFATRTHVDYHDAQVLSALASQLNDRGLRAHSVHAPIADSLRKGVWGTPYSLATADQAARTLAVEETLAALRAAAFLQAGFLVVHLGLPAAQQPDVRDNRRDAALRSLEALHDAAGPLGVRLALEVIPNPLSDAGTLVALIEDDLDAGDVGICLDAGHAFLMGDLTDAIEIAAGHLLTTHLHDNGGTADDHLVPFDGAIDWAQAAMTLQKVGYEGVWLFELAASAEPRRVLERAQAAQRRLERILSV